jgi:hypothetical protein
VTDRPDREYERLKNGEGAQDELDRWLNDALARYSTAEPRPGLEERILTNLRDEQMGAPAFAWWQWVMVPVLAVAVMAYGLWWQFGKSNTPPIANHPIVSAPSVNVPEREIAHRDPNTPTPRKVEPIHRARLNLPVMAVKSASPKLDQFPSPQPLSEQELALAKYASAYPEEATLIATAQSEFENETQRKANQFRSEAEAHAGEER